MLSLQNKVALVTGASYGIGKAVAIGLAREGCKVILVARNEDGLNATAERIKAHGGEAIICKADISSLDDIHKIAHITKEKFSHLDILWNGACGWIEGPIESNDEKELAYFLDSSVKGTILLTKTLMPLLLDATFPHIINVVADWEFPVMDGLTAFIATKRAIAGMGIALAKEKMGKVKITNIHPADVASGDEYDIDDSVQDVLRKTENAMIPLGELVDLVLLILKLEGTIVHQIDIKPLNQEIGMTFL